MKRAKRWKKTKINIYIRIAVIIILAIIAITLIRNTIARYRSSATSNANVDLAFYVLKAGDISQDLKVDSILPSDTAYPYPFSIANYDGTKRTETALEYTIQIKTTTNLPLQFSVYDQNDPTTDLITNITTTPDDDGTYFRYITVSGGEFGFTQNQKNDYDLKIKFDDDYSSAEYEGIIEYIQITVRSNQKIGS